MHINEMLGLFRERYSRRNRLCFPYGLHELLQLLGQSVAKLNRAIRKNEPPEIFQIRLVDTVAWLCAVVNHFGNLPFAEAFTAKYGGMECFYCGERSCTCDPKDRPEAGEISFETIPLGSQGKTIRQWCHHLDILYGQRNREAGIYPVMVHLIEEMNEVLCLTGITIFEINDLGEFERQFALELADILAHLIAIANLKQIDLTKAIQERYGNYCPECQREFCHCPRLMIAGDRAQRIGSVS